MHGSWVPTLYTFLGYFSCKSHQKLAFEDLEVRRTLEMYVHAARGQTTCVPVEASPRAR
jgi:hypothetical protein